MSLIKSHFVKEREREEGREREREREREGGRMHALTVYLTFTQDSLVK